LWDVTAIHAKTGKFAGHQKSGVAATFRLFECVKATGGLLCEHGALRAVLSKNACTGLLRDPIAGLEAEHPDHLPHFNAKGEVAGLVAR
jgi:hypothetical protein